MTQLAKLDASGECGLDDHSISQFARGNFIQFNISGNPKITKHYHMTQLAQKK